MCDPGKRKEGQARSARFVWPIDTSLEAATAYDCAIGMLPANVSKKDLAGLGDWLGQQRERCASLKWHEGHTIP